MVRIARVWRLGDRFALHPWEAWGTRSDEGFLARLPDSATAEGTWWNVVHADGQLYVSEIPATLCTNRAAAPLTGTADHSECRIDAEPERLAHNTSPLSESAIVSLLHDPLGYKKLAGEYWNSSRVRETIRECVERAPSRSVELTNACLTSTLARDKTLWNAVATRAREPDNLAESCLRDWPDERGVSFFKDGLLNATRPLIGNAFLFFLTCCSNHGIELISGLLGDPFASKPPTERAGTARLQALKAAADFYAQTGRDVDNTWREFAAASLLVSSACERDLWLFHKGLEVLRRAGDARVQAIVTKLEMAGLSEPDLAS